MGMAYPVRLGAKLTVQILAFRLRRMGCGAGNGTAKLARLHGDAEASCARQFVAWHVHMESREPVKLP